MKIELQKLESASEMLKAIAHPIRIAIVGMLDNDTKLTVTEIYETLGIEQAVASHHLSILKNKGVHTDERIKYHSKCNIKNPHRLKIQGILTIP